MFWKEYAFGLFVFIVMFLASVLYLLSFVVTIPGLVITVLLGLPMVFYIFSFLDLKRAMQKKRGKLKPTQRAVTIVLIVGFLYQILAPSAPINFFIRNYPEPFVMEDNRLSPFLRKGDLLRASRLAYRVDFIPLGRPLMYNLPTYFEIVRFKDTLDVKRVGMVVGLPGDYIEVADGELVVNGLQKYKSTAVSDQLGGYWELTEVGEYSILIAITSLGRVEKMYQTKLSDLIGKVGPLY